MLVDALGQGCEFPRGGVQTGQVDVRFREGGAIEQRPIASKAGEKGVAKVSYQLVRFAHGLPVCYANGPKNAGSSRGLAAHPDNSRTVRRPFGIVGVKTLRGQGDLRFSIRGKDVARSEEHTSELQ